MKIMQWLFGCGFHGFAYPFTDLPALVLYGVRCELRWHHASAHQATIMGEVHELADHP